VLLSADSHLFEAISYFPEELFERQTFS